MNKNYIPLSCKTQGSICLSQTSAKDLVTFAKKEGFEAVGLCDIDSLSQSMSYYEACLENEMKPIFGLQLRICSKPAEIKIDNPTNKHLILIAKNLAGWKSLLKILYITNKPEYYDDGGRISIEQLAPYLNENLIVIYHEDLSQRECNLLHNSCKHFFLGHNPIEGLPVSECNLSYDIVPIFPNYYLTKQDKDINNFLLCKKYGNITIDKANKDIHPAFESDYYHFQTEPERFKSINEEMIQNTRKIYNLIEQFDITIPPQFVKVECPNNWSEDRYLKQKCWDGMRRLGLPHKKEYLERISYELGVISEAGMSGYFLIMEDIINWGIKNGILYGVGRGSAGGCLISYLIGITKVDPIKHDLIFERFYSPSRKGYPDIDIDMQPSQRDKLIDYLIDKYGPEHFMQFCTFGTLKGKSALKVAMQGSNKQIPASLQNEISKRLPEESRLDSELEEQQKTLGTRSSILYVLHNTPKTIEKWCKLNIETNKLEGEFAEEFEHAIKLNSIIVSRGRHASAFVLGQTPLYEMVPIVYDKKSKKHVIAVDMNDGEKMGAIKLDLLGITLLDEYSYCKKVLNGNKIIQRIDGWRPIQV